MDMKSFSRTRLALYTMFVFGLNAAVIAAVVMNVPLQVVIPSAGHPVSSEWGQAIQRIEYALIELGDIVRSSGGNNAPTELRLPAAVQEVSEVSEVSLSSRLEAIEASLTRIQETIATIRVRGGVIGSVEESEIYQALPRLPTNQESLGVVLRSWPASKDDLLFATVHSCVMRLGRPQQHRLLGHRIIWEYSLDVDIAGGPEFLLLHIDGGIVVDVMVGNRR